MNFSQLALVYMYYLQYLQYYSSAAQECLSLQIQNIILDIK